jgi:hypothetical protein
MAEGGMQTITVGSARTSRPVLSRIEIVANERSGGVGPGAAAAAEAIARELGFDVRSRALDPDALIEGLKDALASRPDLLVVIAGDGLDVRIDPARAELEGVSPDEASKQLEALLSGAVATQVQSGANLADVRVWIPPPPAPAASSWAP